MSVTLDPLLVLLALTAITFPSFIHCTPGTGGKASYRQVNVNFSPLAINCSWSPSIVTSGSSEIQIKLLGQSDIFQSCCSFEITNTHEGDYSDMKSLIQNVTSLFNSQGEQESKGWERNNKGLWSLWVMIWKSKSNLVIYHKPIPSAHNKLFSSHKWWCSKICHI